MIQIRSWVDIADNTGARRATMIGVIGKKSLEAGIGDIITANVKEAAHDGTVSHIEATPQRFGEPGARGRNDDGFSHGGSPTDSSET